MKTLEKIDPMSLGRVYGLILGIFGFVTGIVVALGFTMNVQGMMPLASFGALSIIALPILYGLLGFVSGYATAWLYNIVAKKIGGVKVDIR